MDYMKEIFQILKEGTTSSQFVIEEELQGIEPPMETQQSIPLETQDVVTDQEIIDQMSNQPDYVMYNPALPNLDDLNNRTIEQKKILLLDYYDKLIDNTVLIRDFIDNLSFDLITSDNAMLNVAELQVFLDELNTKMVKYLEDQYETDKYERALYVYLSFREELMLIVKLLQKQLKKN